MLMITPELIARINELARKKRTVGLSEDELVEQKKLYGVYLAGIREQMTGLLDSIEFVDIDSGGEVRGSSKKNSFVRQATINLEQVYH